jgi:general secretion pathway protein G
MFSRLQASSPRRRAAGWTLIELMMVTVLIGILSAVALPIYGKYRNQARVASSGQQIIVMSTLIKSWAIDHGEFPPDLATVGIHDAVDPWGRPYVYYNVDANGKGGARKDRALNPLNTDFDLYSIGLDGKTKSQVSHKDSLDDVIRARNGAFNGKAEAF